MVKYSDYASEFDELVNELNRGVKEMDLKLANPSISKKKVDWKSFWDGFCSVFDVSGNYLRSRVLGEQANLYSNSSYLKPDLSVEQRDAVALASDWKRVDRTLDKIINGEASSWDLSVKSAQEGKIVVQQMYDYYFKIYVSHIKS